MVQGSQVDPSPPHVSQSSPADHMAVGQNNGFGVGAPPILAHFSGDWDVHWGYGILTHGHISTQHKRPRDMSEPLPPSNFPQPKFRGGDYRRRTFDKVRPLSIRKPAAKKHDGEKNGHRELWGGGALLFPRKGVRFPARFQESLAVGTWTPGLSSHGKSPTNLRLARSLPVDSITQVSLGQDPSQIQ